MKPKKSIGQNFLSEEKTLDSIVDLGNIHNDDIILEIGPGTGNLTEKIINKNPKKIIVIEKDKNLSDALKINYGHKIEIINDDILNCYDNIKFDKPIKVFGNLPYNISTKILISFLKLDNLDKLFVNFIFIFQREVADRIVAKYNTKHYGRLSILSSWKMNTSKIFDIPPKYFYPVPKVWSSLVFLKPKQKIAKIKYSKSLEHITNIFFNQRRKMIKKPIKQIFNNHENISKKLNIDLTLRPQNLSIDNYFEICKIYEDLL